MEHVSVRDRADIVVDLSVTSGYTTDVTVRTFSGTLAERTVTDMINKHTIQKTPRVAVSFALACLLACGGTPAPALAEMAEEAMEVNEAGESAANSATATPAATTASGTNVTSITPSEQNPTDGAASSSASYSQVKEDETTDVVTNGGEGDLGTSDSTPTATATTTTTATTTDGEMDMQPEGTSGGLTKEMSADELSGEETIAGAWGTCTWEIDANGVLTIRSENAEESVLLSDMINRGQLAVVLWSMAGKPAPKGMPKLFPDVSASKYCYDAVAWASSVGVVNGYGDGRFGSDDLITREQLAVMLTNYAGMVAKKDTTGSAADYASVKDATKVSRWASNCVGWCFRHKIMSVTEKGLIDPHGNITCAEAAKTVVSLRGIL